MKAWTACLAAVVLTLWLGLPFRARDTARLLPVRTVQISCGDGGVYLRSEFGQVWGADWPRAVEELQETAPGDIFLDTAQQLILCGSAESLLPQIVQSGILRPAAQVYHAQELCAAEGLNALLNAHESGVTVGGVAAALAREETICLPEVPDGG